nr:MAG TPA: hypothetical protein [Caudoviricetes sp.]
MLHVISQRTLRTFRQIRLAHKPRALFLGIH